MSERDYMNDVPVPVDEYLNKELFDEKAISESADEIAEADPVIKRAMQREAGVWEITRQIAPSPSLYSGSGTKMEVIELEDNIRRLVQEGSYTYPAMEDYLITLNYNLDDIRKAFERVTGISPMKYLSRLTAFEFTPSSVPPVTLGWGESKAKEYDYLFIMPYRSGYQVFGQKGDIVRDEVEYLLDKDEAYEYLRKKTNKTMIREPKMDDATIEADKLEALAAPIVRKTSMEYKNISDYLYRNREVISDNEVKAILEGAEDAGKIDADEKHELYKEAGFALEAREPDIEDQINPDLTEKEEEVIDTRKDILDKTRELQDRPVDDMFSDTTPNDFFESEMVAEEADASQNIEEVLKYIAKKSDALSNYEIVVQSFKYDIYTKVKNDFEKNIEVGNEEIKEYLAASAIMPVLVEVESLEDEALNVPPLKGMIIFSIVDNEIITDDLVKFENNKIYSLTNEGLYSAFAEYMA